MTNLKQMFLTRGLAATAVVAMTLLMATPGWSQCNGNCGGSTSSYGECSGRCTYCVEGKCVPKRETYGHYETTWRKWRVPAPVVPERSRSRSRSRQGSGEGQVELPEAIDESEIDPEFSHLKEVGDGQDSDVFSAIPSDMTIESETGGLMEGGYPIESDLNFIDEAPTPSVDLPEPEAEQPVDVPAPADMDFDLESRSMPKSQRAVAVDDSMNPLRRENVQTQQVARELEARELEARELEPTTPRLVLAHSTHGAAAIPARQLDVKPVYYILEGESHILKSAAPRQTVEPASPGLKNPLR